MQKRERQKILFDWNATQAEFPEDSCIQHLFEGQVAEHPDAVALIEGDRSLTYRELNVRANSVAQHLLSLGCKPDDLLAICIERSAELFIGLLGILKAGCAYVPLDVGYPAERIDYMLRDSNAPVLLSSTDVVKQLALVVPALQKCQTVCLDRGSEVFQTTSVSEAIQTEVLPNNLAYCIYTSGSTGNPKGVLMEHRSLVNMLWWHRQTRPSVQGVRTLQFCAVSFDFSFHEIFSTLCLGGTLVLVSEEVRRNPFALAAFICDNEIEKLFLPVTALQQLAEAVDSGMLPTSLREVITTGEQLQITPPMVNLFRQTGAMLHNHYGATEFQDATTFTLSGDPTDWPALAPIGCPLSNVQIYILDESGQPVPHGEVGELYIAGSGVARGYLKRPELTKERFIPNPFGGGRLYRTGDLARYQADGTIENLGRADYQVKIRGIRIELGEIEAILAKHPAVKENAIMAHDYLGHKRLVAYIVARKDEPSEDLLHSYLEKRLPDYMLPEAFVVLERMPLTPSGKINRRALPVPKIFRRTLVSSVSMPQSETEQLLAEIWQEVLTIETVGIHDNFFDIGATSLLLIQVYKRLKETFDQLSALALFQYPTIHTLAQHLSQQQVPRKGKPQFNENRFGEVLQKSRPDTTLEQARMTKQCKIRRTHRARKARMARSVPQIKPRTINIWPSVGEYPVYDAYLYHLMSNVDRPRNGCYETAINQVVKDKTVVDIGTGQDAILSVFCVQGGAKKVYAIERDINSYRLAVAHLERLGMSDVVSVIHGEAAEVKLPELVDVCVSEVIGNIGGSEGVAVILNDARRFLKPNGIMIPERCVTFIAACTLPQDVLHRPKMDEIPSRYAKKIFEAIGYPFDVRICMGKFPKENRLSDSGIFENLRFTQTTNTAESTEFNLTIKQDGRWDGFILWLNLYVIESEVVDTLAHEGNWAPVYFPIFEPGVEVSRGDVIQATCQRSLSDNQINPDYVIHGRLIKRNGHIFEFEHGSYYRKAQFRQHLFYQRIFASKRWNEGLN